jgi:hypothetical protein
MNEIVIGEDRGGLEIGAAAIMSKAMPYTVMVDDNFHFMDESHRWPRGEYATLEEAIAECKRMVDEDLATMHKSRMTAPELTHVRQPRR